MNPFEVRLAILKMAQELLQEEYYNKKQVIDNNWSQQTEMAKELKSPLPAHPGYPTFPSEDEIKKKATALYEFVQIK